MEEQKQLQGYRIKKKQQSPIHFTKEQSQLFFKAQQPTNMKINQDDKSALCLLPIQKLQDQRQDNLQNLLRLRDLVKQTLETKQIIQSSDELVVQQNTQVDESINSIVKTTEKERKSESKKYFELFLEICQRESTLLEVQKRLIKKSGAQELQVLESQRDIPDQQRDCSMNQIVQQMINMAFHFAKQKQQTQRMLTQHLYSFLTSTRRRSQVNTPINTNENYVQSANLSCNDDISELILQSKEQQNFSIKTDKKSSKLNDFLQPKQPYFQSIQTQILKIQLHNYENNNSTTGLSSRNSHQQLKYQHRVKLPVFLLKEDPLFTARSPRVKTNLLIESNNSISSQLNSPNGKASISPFQRANVEEKNESKCYKIVSKLNNLSCPEQTSPQGSNNQQFKQILNYSKQTNQPKQQQQNDQTNQHLERMYSNLLKANCMIQTSIKNYFEETSQKMSTCAAFIQTIREKSQHQKQENSIKKLTLTDQIVQKIKNRKNLLKITETLSFSRKPESNSNERSAPQPTRPRAHAYPSLEFRRKGIKLTHVLFESLTENEAFSKLSVSASPREQLHNLNKKVKQDITPCYSGRIKQFPQQVADRSFNLIGKSIEDKNVKNILESSFSWKKQSSERRFQPLPFYPSLAHLKIGSQGKNDLSAGKLTPNQLVNNFDFPITFRAKQVQPQFQYKQQQQQQQTSLLKYLSCSSMQIVKPCGKSEKGSYYPLELDYPAVDSESSPFKIKIPQEEESLQQYLFSKQKETKSQAKKYSEDIYSLDL